MDIVEWWGVCNLFSIPVLYLTKPPFQLNAHRYPTWASLARDYLSVMASSVSSERAFSLAGITITKRRNRLKGDVVEALQCMKCIYHNELLFREVQVASDIEKELDAAEVVDVEMGSDEVLEEADRFSWDSMIVDDDDEEDLE